jgi:hypothetical protein
VILLFANAFGAIATAYALTSSRSTSRPSCLRADPRRRPYNAHLGYAIAFGMIATGLATSATSCFAPREVAVKGGRFGRGSSSSWRRLLFIPSSHAGILCACGAASIPSTYKVVLADVRSSKVTFRIAAIFTIIVGILIVVPAAY